MCVGFHLYLTGQSKPRDCHVGVQHLELGLQRQSHTGKRRERARKRKTKVLQGETTTSALPSSMDINGFLILNRASILMLYYLELRGNLVVTSAGANLVSEVNPCTPR